MLNKQENELVTRVGPGTPMGEVLRRYWMPFLLEEDLPGPDCAPVRVRLLGEDLVAFRDSDGRVGLLDELCPHRLASLFLGRNEENGLRCVYHGWKFDTTGQCTDMPNEPADSAFKEKVQALSYPTVVLGGVIWAYMGPLEVQPDPPGMEWLRAPETHRFVSKTIEFANFVQAIEGGIDTSHSSFLHNNNLADKKSLGQIDRSPRLEVEKTDYGFRYAGIRDAREKGSYVRIYQFIMPFHQFRSGQIDKGKGERPEVPLIKGHMWTPIDDETTCVFNWMYAVDEDRPLTPEFILENETFAGRGPNGETVVRHHTRENNWLIDRAAQRNQTFTGIAGLNTQDLAVQESMGRVVERWREHLGTTDRAIIAMRQMLLSAIRDVREGGDPPGVNPKSYRGVRATDLILPKDARWQEDASQELVAAR